MNLGHPQRRGDREGTASEGTRRGSAARRRDMRRTLEGPQTVESYLRASAPPRYMRRLREIEAEYRAQRRRLEAAYEAFHGAYGEDAARFAALWRARARTWPFDRLNDLIREHNTWYPVEANLPMDPRTKDYRLVRGNSYRRLELGPRWVLEHFPPSPELGTVRPEPPPRAPREPVRRAVSRRAG